jgi:hypothetical protein
MEVRVIDPREPSESYHHAGRVVGTAIKAISPKKRVLKPDPPAPLQHLIKRALANQDDGLKAERADFTDIGPTRQNNSQSGRAHSEVEPSAILNTPSAPQTSPHHNQPDYCINHGSAIKLDRAGKAGDGKTYSVIGATVHSPQGLVGCVNPKNPEVSSADRSKLCPRCGGEMQFYLQTAHGSPAINRCRKCGHSEAVRQ